MRRCKPQNLIGEIEQEAQPSVDTDINKEKHEVICGVLDPESGVTTVEIQDDELAHDSAWTKSEVLHRPRRNRKSPVWLRMTMSIVNYRQFVNNTLLHKCMFLFLQNGEY
jgi:hypothetical protein